MRAPAKPSGVTSLTAAQPNDQYVAKHFPFPWFQSLTGSAVNGPALNEPSNGGANCDANHIANLDSPTTGLVHDLQNPQSTPDFAWITPDNCSDAHDAICKSNNLSGAFTASGTPDYNSPIPYVPESTRPKNYTGGLYASDLFLEYYIPLIEQSQAFKQGGLIDVTFDEAFPPFTYTGNSFNDANNYPPTPDNKPNYTSSIRSDTAGENLYGRNVSYEPTGPNSTLGTNAKGDQLYPGPGNNAFVDRPPVCTQTSPALVPANCVPGIVRGGAGSPPGARTDTVTGGTGSNVITDPSILSNDTGRAVTGTGIPANSFVGAVTNTGPEFPTTNTGAVTTGSFGLVGQNGSPIDPTGPVSSITLSADDGVEVKTSRWSVLATVSGPQVPGEGLPYQASSTTCTWGVTMSGATGPVPISTSDFTSIDDEDQVYRLVLVPGQPKPPTVLRPGQKVSFELRAVDAVGEGLMRWAPDGRNIVAKWDFVVEND